MRAISTRWPCASSRELTNTFGARAPAHAVSAILSSMSWTSWQAVFRRRTRIRPEAQARVSGKLDVAAYLERVMNGEARSVGDAGDLNAMAMCIKQGAYEHFRRKGAGARGQRNPFVDVMDVLAGRP